MKTIYSIPTECRKSSLFSCLLTFAFLLLIALTLILPFSSKIVCAGEGKLALTWDPNQDSDLAGYVIYYGRSSGIYEVAVDVGDNTSCVLSGLEEGEIYYCAATAYDRDDNESDFSVEVSGLVPGTDTDGDGITDDEDNCPDTPNPFQEDRDGDGVGDACQCEGNFDNDSDVDGSDLAVFAADFGRTDCSGGCKGDLDGDGDVDGRDLAVFAADFGRRDCPHD